MDGYHFMKFTTVVLSILLGPMVVGVGYGSDKSDPLTNSLGMRFVSIPDTAVKISVWETRVKDYAAFVEANPKSNKSWKEVTYKGVKQNSNHPVVNVSFRDAEDFCRWLSKKEDKEYRLPTDHEWSLAVGIGKQEDPNLSPKEKDGKIDDVFPWGRSWPPPKDAANLQGQEGNIIKMKIKAYRDRHSFTAPVGSYLVNSLGIYDLAGNVWEWCQGAYEEGKDHGFVRGGSFINNLRSSTLSSHRDGTLWPDYRGIHVGFRCVLRIESETPSNNTPRKK